MIDDWEDDLCISPNTRKTKTANTGATYPGVPQLSDPHPTYETVEHIPDPDEVEPAPEPPKPKQTKRPTPPKKRNTAKPRAAKSAMTEEQSKKRKTVMLTICACMIVSDVAVLAMFLLGTGSFFGESVGVVTAVNLIFNLFKTNLAVVYRSLFGAAVGVAYFIIVVMSVIGLIKAIKRTVSMGKYAVDFSTIGSVCDKCAQASVLTLVFCMACALLSPGDIGITLIITFAICALQTAACAFVSVNRDVFNVKRGALASASAAVKYFAVGVLYFLLLQPMFRELMYGLQALFNGNVLSGGAVSAFYALYGSIVEPGLFVAIAVCMCVLLFEMYGVSGSSGRYVIKTMLTLTLVTLGLHFIFKMLIVGASSMFRASMFVDWLLNIASSYLPILLTEIGLTVFIKYSKLG